MTVCHFDPAPRLWLTSLGISGVIGFGLILSVSGGGQLRRDFWVIARLFLMPFCVSSFSALVKDRGFMLILSPQWHENVIALAGCAGFVLLCFMVRRFGVPLSAPAQKRIAE
ncbi:MAG: hypothetical protein AB7T07_13110 [Steroidobacteraceae bacterium]